jgi:hypothetical protein
MTTTPTAPNLAVPPGVAELTEWCDLHTHPEDAFRSFTGPRRGIDRKFIGTSPNGPHYVEAAGSQDISGGLFDLGVHAQINLWGMNRHQDYDTMLTAPEARRCAIELRSDAATLTRLAEAFEAAASEVDHWDGWAAE